MPIFALEAQEGNVQFVSVASPAEMCMAARFSFTVANRTLSHALICLPFPMVRMLVDSLQARTALGDDVRQVSMADDTRRRLFEIPLDVVFQFPSFVTTPAELMFTIWMVQPCTKPPEAPAAGSVTASEAVTKSTAAVSAAITSSTTAASDKVSGTSAA